MTDRKCVCAERRVERKLTAAALNVYIAETMRVWEHSALHLHDT